jgi:hypothetical protein
MRHPPHSLAIQCIFSPFNSEGFDMRFPLRTVNVNQKFLALHLLMRKSDKLESAHLSDGQQHPAKLIKKTENEHLGERKCQRPN